MHFLSNQNHYRLFHKKSSAATQLNPLSSGRELSIPKPDRAFASGVRDLLFAFRFSLFRFSLFAFCFSLLAHSTQKSVIPNPDRAFCERREGSAFRFSLFAFCFSPHFAA